MKRIALALLVAALIVCMLPVAVSAEQATELLCGEQVIHIPMSPSDVIAAQIVTTAPALRLGVACPSYSNTTGSITVNLYAFDTDYDTSLSGEPIASQVFENFADNAYLELTFPEDSPLPAGEYLYVMYDANDPDPGPGTVYGVGYWSCAAHESQRLYVNGIYNSNATAKLQVVYARTPEQPYGIPTVREVTLTDEQKLPDPDHLLVFSDAAAVKSVVGSGNAITGAFKNGALVFSVKQSGDPFINLNLGDVSLSDYPVARIKFRLQKGQQGGNGQLFFTTEQTGISEAASFRMTYEDTENWQYVNINIASNSYGSGTLTSFRWDIFISAEQDAEVECAYILFFKSEEAAALFDDASLDSLIDGAGQTTEAPTEQPTEPLTSEPEQSLEQTTEEGTLSPDGQTSAEQTEDTVDAVTDPAGPSGQNGQAMLHVAYVLLGIDAVLLIAAIVLLICKRK